jgi:prevent-host-death family protein
MVSITRTLSITEARKRIFELANNVQVPGVHYTLTENGRPRVILMSPEEYEGWAETLDILAEDPDVVAEVQRAQVDMKKGEVVSLAALKKKYGIQRSARTKRGKGTR